MVESAKENKHDSVQLEQLAYWKPLTIDGNKYWLLEFRFSFALSDRGRALRLRKPRGGKQAFWQMTLATASGPPILTAFSASRSG
jgi:hypothetical protein